VMIEHLLARIYTSAEAIVDQTRTYGRWFVESHYAPFPLSYEEAEQRLVSSFDIEALTRLSPLYFEQKHRELDGDFMTRSWTLSFESAEIPQATATWRTLQPLVAQTVSMMARSPIAPT